MKNQDLVNQYLQQSELTTIYHLEHDHFDNSEILEREELIISSKEVKLIASRIREERIYIDNEITDNELVTMEINIRSSGLNISREQALDYILDEYVYDYEFSINYNKY